MPKYEDVIDLYDDYGKRIAKDVPLFLFGIARGTGSRCVRVGFGCDVGKTDFHVFAAERFDIIESPRVVPYPQLSVRAANYLNILPYIIVGAPVYIRCNRNRKSVIADFNRGNYNFIIIIFSY